VCEGARRDLPASQATFRRHCACAGGKGVQKKKSAKNRRVKGQEQEKHGRYNVTLKVQAWHRTGTVGYVVRQAAGYNNSRHGRRKYIHEVRRGHPDHLCVAARYVADGEVDREVIPLPER